MSDNSNLSEGNKIMAKKIVNIQLVPSHEFLADIVCTALCGGIGHWACCNSEIDWQGETACTLIPSEDPEDFEQKTLTHESIIKGMQTLIDSEHHDAATIIQALSDDDAGYIDAGIADNIVQAGLLGELTFG